MEPFVFPKWANLLGPVLVLALGSGAVYAAVAGYFGLAPETVNVQYEPEQPMPFSHALHSGELGLDCRYCHNTVETTAKASVPPSTTCWNCHEAIQNRATDGEKLQIQPLVDSINDKNKPIHWVRVHDLPDFVFFDHSIHVNRGVGCASCHGRVDQMDRVRQEHTLSMGWCLNCHREPDKHLRDPAEVTNMDWTPPADQLEQAAARREAGNIKPSTDCSTCHR